MCSLCLIKLYRQHAVILTSVMMTEQLESEGSLIRCLRMISYCQRKMSSLLHLCETIPCEAECLNDCVMILIGWVSFQPG